MIHIGFTGTQKGMTAPQVARVQELLAHKDFFGHHGMCIGADAQFDGIARLSKGFRWMYIHPCTLEDKRAAVNRTEYDIVYSVQDPLTRNRDIVQCSEIMIAAPKTIHEERRSGTWATIRYARESKKKLYILAPNGAVFTENA